MRALAFVSAPFVHLLSGSTEFILRPLLRLFRLRSAEAGAQPMSPEERARFAEQLSGIIVAGR